MAEMDGYTPQVGEPGWTYKAADGKYWTFGEIAALYGGNEYMAKVVIGAMSGQDPREALDALFRSGMIVGTSDGYYAFSNADFAKSEFLKGYLPQIKVEPIYRNTTKNGYTILDRHYHDNGRLDILAIRQFNNGDIDYVVGHGYDVADGSWSYGTYAYSFAEAGSVWDEARGLNLEKSVVVDQKDQHRSLVVPVEDGYLVAQAHAFDSPRTGEIDLEFWNRSGELVSDIANIAKYKGGNYMVEAYDFGHRASGHAYTFDAVDVAQQPVSYLSEARREHLEFPREVEEYIPDTLEDVRARAEERDRELDKQIVEDGMLQEGKGTLSRYVIGGVEGVTWSVTVDARSEAEARELAEQAYEAYFEDPAYLEKMAGVVEFDHGWEADHSTKVWDVYEVPAQRKPSELKNAPDKPRSVVVTPAIPTADAKSCGASAKAQAVDAILDRVSKKR